MKGEHILSVDLGTTHLKTFLYDVENGAVWTESLSYSTQYRKPGYAEQDADAVLEAALRLIRRTVEKSGVESSAVKALVFSGIWQSFLPVGRDGKPLCPAWIWSDGRAAEQAGKIAKMIGKRTIKETTGCAPHPMYHYARILWLKEQAPDILAAADRILSIKEYVLHALFGVYYADLSVASGSGLLDMATLSWSKDILEAAGGKTAMLPELVEPTSIVGGLTGDAAESTGLPAGTPGIIGAADGAMAHLGSVGMSAEVTSLTVSTGSAARRLIDRPYVMEDNDAFCYYMAEGSWLLGGVNHDAGNALEWLGSKVLFPEVSSDSSGFSIFQKMNELAGGVPAGSDGLLFLPYMGGERCPASRPDASGSIAGLKYYHTNAHIIRALMEGISFRMYSLYRMIWAETAVPAGKRDEKIVLTGGILKSPVWLEILANVFGTKIYSPVIQEATSLGNVLVALKVLGSADTLEKPGVIPDAKVAARCDDSVSEIYRERYRHFTSYP